MKPKSAALLFKIGTAVLVWAVLAGSAVGLLKHTETDQAHLPVPQFAHRNYTDVAPTSKPTGFVTLKPKDLPGLKQALDSQHISYQEVGSLGLLRLKENDAAKIPPDQSSALVDRTDKEITYSILRTPNDPQYASQSYLSTIQADTGWDIATGSTAVTVAVLDSGIDGAHPDLRPKMVGGYDYVNNRALTGAENSDDEGHGTLIAGIVGALGDNGVGVAGVDWTTNVMPIKVIRSDGSGTDTNVAAGLRYAVDHGARVVNMSFGGAASQTLKDQIDYASSKGVIMVAAAGNTGNETTLYPAGWDEVVAVGSVSSSLTRSSFSTYGSYLDMVAPGENILSTNNTGGYTTASGTSVAAPFVSGAASLLIGQNTAMSKDDVISAIENTARDVDASGFDKFTGHGLVQIHGALQSNTLYHYGYVGQNANPDVAPGTSYNFTLQLKNTGGTTWQKGVINLATDRAEDRIPAFLRESGNGNSSGWTAPNRVTMQESSVPAGTTAHFSFYMEAPSNMAPGTYREYFRPVADGITWLPEDYGIYWDVHVLSPLEQYRHQFVGQNSYPTSLGHGQAYQFSVTVKNTGTATWQKGTVNLATNRVQDRIPVFTRESSNGSASGWISANRITMQEATVAPGATATFSFWLRNDATAPGTYREYFRLVADGVGWMEDYGIYWDVTVP